MNQSDGQNASTALSGSSQRNALGEFLVLTHINTPPQDIFHDEDIIKAPSTILVHNEYYKPHLESAKRNPRQWRRTAIGLRPHGHIAFTYPHEKYEELFVAISDDDKSLWKKRSEIENLAVLPITVTPKSYSSIDEFLDERTIWRPQLYAAEGDFRKTPMYKELLDQRIEKFRAAIQEGIFEHIEQEYEHLNKYFALSDLVRKCGDKFLHDFKKYSSAHGGEAIADAIRSSYMAASSRSDS